MKHTALHLILLAFLSLSACSQPPESTPIAQPVDPAKETVPPQNITEDWPKFLGLHQNSTSRETNLLTDWPPQGPPVLWSRPIGVSYGSPVVSRGRLILFHRIGNEEVIECVDALDGSKVYWTDTYPTTYRDRYGYNGGPRSSATIDGDRVYTNGAQGVLTCLDVETGARIWQRQVSRDFNVLQGFFGVGTAPVIENDLLLLNVGGPDGAGVVAFNKQTGETVWKTSHHTASYSTPIIATIRGERLAIFYTGDGLLVVEPETGKERYAYPFRSRIRESAIAASPVLVNDIVFLSATYRIGAVALQLTPDGLKEVWKDAEALQTHWATSIYHEGNLYGMHGRHEGSARFRCIDFGTGEVLWTAPDDYSRDPGARRKRLGRASFIMADGHLIAMGEHGELALIEVSPERYIEKARAKYLDGPVYTPPILANGLLYIRNERKLICLDLRK